MCTNSTKNEIAVANGLTALVSPGDYELLSAYKWHTDGKGYVRYCQYLGGGRINQKSRWIYMHRLILLGEMGEADLHIRVDHVNGDRLDNRRENLRRASLSENTRNMNRRSEASGFKGVYPYFQTGRWQARIYVDKAPVRLGVFGDVYEAAKAYDAAARKSFGEFARLNFPQAGEQGISQLHVSQTMK